MAEQDLTMLMLFAVPEGTRAAETYKIFMAGWISPIQGVWLLPPSSV